MHVKKNKGDCPGYFFLKRGHVPPHKTKKTGNRWRLLRLYSLSPDCTMYERGVFAIPVTIPFRSKPLSVCSLTF